MWCHDLEDRYSRHVRSGRVARQPCLQRKRTTESVPRRLLLDQDRPPGRTDCRPRRRRARPDRRAPTGAARRAVTVIEREPLPGGLAAGFEIEPGMWLEKFYHHLFRSDRRAVAMIEELGLGDRLEWKAPVTATLRDGRLHQLDSPVVADAVLAAAGGRSGPHGRCARDPQGDAEPAPAGGSDRRRTGLVAGWAASAYDVVWEPLLRGKFGEAAPEIAMPWFWARVHDRTQQLGYLRGGFQQLYDRARRARPRRRWRDALRHVGRHRSRPMATRSLVETDAGTERFDRVVSTLATRLTARLVPELPAGVARSARMGSSRTVPTARSWLWIGR